MNQLGFENIKISCQMILLPLRHCTLNGIPSRTIRLSFIYCVRNIFRRVWTHTNVLTAIIAQCLFLHCTLFGFAKVIVYLIFCYRPATTSFASSRKQTEGTRNQSALGREVTPLKSPTPDQTSQVRTDYESGRFILYRFFLKRGGEAIKSQPPLALNSCAWIWFHLELRVCARKGVAPHSWVEQIKVFYIQTWWLFISM